MGTIVLPASNRPGPYAAEALDKIEVAAEALRDETAGPRLLLGPGGEALHYNAAAAPLAALLADPESDARRMVRQWLDGGGTGELALTLPEADAPRRYRFQGLAVTHAGGDPAVLLIGGAPDLGAHIVQALAESRQLYKDLVACTAGFAWETDRHGRFSFVAHSELLGHRPETLMGRRAADCFGLDPDSANMLFKAQSPVEQADIWLPHGDGRRICLQISARPVRDKDGQWRGCRGMGLDVTHEREQADALADALAEISQLARTDALTGLANRGAFDEAIAPRLAHSRRTGRPGALLLIDLDYFKQVNDRLGHAAGDAVLKQLGAQLKLMVRAADIAARLGGDEFALWLEETDKTGAEAMAQRLLGLSPDLRRAAGGPADRLSMSVGAALCGPGDMADGLMARADAALYRAKNAGRDQYCVSEHQD